MRREIFGSVDSLVPIDSSGEADGYANDSRHGLPICLLVNDLQRVMAAFEGIGFGVLHVNRVGPEDPPGLSCRLS